MASKTTQPSPLYSPNDDFSKEIENKIQTHPVTQSLRSNSSFIERRFYQSLPESAQKHLLTGWSLLGPDKITVYPIYFLAKDGKSIFVIIYFGDAVCSHPGIVHGGLLATLLDEVMATCSWACLPQKTSITVSLMTRFLKRAPVNNFYLIKGEVKRLERKVVLVDGTIEILREDAEQLDSRMKEVAVAHAQGMYVVPRVKERLHAML